MVINEHHHLLWARKLPLLWEIALEFSGNAVIIDGYLQPPVYEFILFALSDNLQHNITTDLSSFSLEFFLKFVGQCLHPPDLFSSVNHVCIENSETIQTHSSTPEYVTEDLHILQCHLQLYKVVTDEMTPLVKEGLFIHRQWGDFPSLSGSTGKNFAQKRLSVLCISAQPNVSYSEQQEDNLPLFKAVVLDDSKTATSLQGLRMDGSYRRPRGISGPHMPALESEFPLEIAGSSAAFELFQPIVYKFLEEWKSSWIDCIDALDESIRIQVEDIKNDEKVKKMMFDKSFERSRLYFRLLQTLHLFTDNIKRTRESIVHLSRSFQGSAEPSISLIKKSHKHKAIQSHLTTEVRTLETNWEIVINFHDEAEKILLERIATKTEEIKTFQDGLFNATALREAMEGMLLNRAIYVFTIVTVLYTPVGFLAVSTITAFVGELN
ncbi:hypothetical protein F4779DRAFT_642002 [Xylariaceae sp. FL0662B]|nr:hypothetical protein F4779DRAFT_642002 [Xylariaceae sp. FL0662B]